MREQRAGEVDRLPARAAQLDHADIMACSCSNFGSQPRRLGRYQLRAPSSFIVAGSRTRADDRGVDQDRGGEADADLLRHLIRAEREGAEHGDHHERGAGDDARGRLDAVGDGVVVAHAAVDGLADAAEDEHVVVHREAEEDHEQEQRDPGATPPTDWKSSSVSPWPSWKTSTRTP